jgi:hypothetical protein
MPTILINTNIARTPRSNKINNNNNNLTNNVASSDETSKQSSNNEEFADDLDADFRQDLNTIITKLLNKSQKVTLYIYILP